MSGPFRVGDLITFGPGAEPLVFLWWERLLRRVTCGRYRMRGRPDRRIYRVTAIDGDSGVVTIDRRTLWRRMFDWMRAAHG